MPPAGPLAHACTCSKACPGTLLHPHRALEHKTVKMSHRGPPSGPHTHPAIPTTIQNSHTGHPAGQHRKIAAESHTPRYIPVHHVPACICSHTTQACCATQHCNHTRGTTGSKRKKGGQTGTGDAPHNTELCQYVERVMQLDAASVGFAHPTGRSYPTPGGLRATTMRMLLVA